MATYSNNLITREVVGEIPAYRLVKSAEGKITLAGAKDDIYGAVIHRGSETNKDLYPSILQVHAGQYVVPLETEDKGFKEGDVVFAAKDGKVSKKGTQAVGIVDLPEHDRRGVKTVRVHLFHPASKGSGSGSGSGSTESAAG